MQVNKKDRVKIGIIIGLSAVLITVVSLRLLKSKTADGVLVPVTSDITLTKLSTPRLPIPNLESDQKKDEALNRPDMLILTRDIFQPLKPPPMRNKKGSLSKATEVQKPPPALELKGTITGGREPLAIVDDRFVRCGDVIQDYTVTRIDDDKIVLRSGEKEIPIEVFKVDPVKR
jgi:hypothetical protein